MAGKSRGQKAKLFEAGRNAVSVPGATNSIMSFVNIDRTIINLILPYFDLKSLIYAERINHQFRSSIINFYRSMETFDYRTVQRRLQKWLVKGLVDKICNYLPNVTCLQVHALFYLRPLSQLSLLTRLTIICFQGRCTEFEFKALVISLKTIAHQLRVLDLLLLRLNDENDDAADPDQYLLSDFLMLQELRLGRTISIYLPNVVLQNLQILQYYDDHKLLHTFCKKNVQIEELLIFALPNFDNKLMPCSSIAILRNLRVLITDSYWINDNLAKQLVGCCSKLTDFTLRFSRIESDDAMKIIYNGLFKTLLKLELYHVYILSINAVRGIHKLENLECLILHVEENSAVNVEDGIAIDEILSLKSLHMLHIGNIRIAFGASAVGKFQSLDELKILNDEKTNCIKILDFCTDRLKSFEIEGLMPNERWMQLGNDFPNLHTLRLVHICPPAEEALKHLSRKLINLKYLDTSYHCGVASLVPFIQNSKHLTTIITNLKDKLKKHPDVKHAQNSGRYIDIRSMKMMTFAFGIW